LARALYLPESWTNDAARRETAGAPAAVRFATEGPLAHAVLAVTSARVAQRGLMIR
jgi:hypothetical protein